MLEERTITSGWQTDSVAFTLEYRHGSNRLRQRLVQRPYPSGEQARVEAELLVRLSELGIAVPSVELIADDEQPPFVVLEWIDGPTVEESGDPALLTHMARQLAELHSLDWRAVFDQPPDAIDEWLARLRGTAAYFGLEPFEPLLDWLGGRRPADAQERISILHNDYYPGNVLLDGDRLVIIDWSFAAPGDYRLDLAWTAMLLGASYGEETRERFLADYAEASGSAIEDFEFYEALKLGDRMLTLATWLEGHAAIPVPKITREAMKDDYKVHVLNPYRRLKQVTGIELSTFEEL